MSNEEKKEQEIQEQKPKESQAEANVGEKPAKKEEIKADKPAKEEEAKADKPAESQSEVKEEPKSEEASKEEAPKEEAPKEVAKKNDAPADQRRGGGKGRPQRRRRPDRQEKEDDGTVERVVSIKRVSKVVKGGKNFSFSAMVVAGDGQGQVGLGLGKSNEVVEAIKKGSSVARTTYKKITLKGETIPHEVIGRFKASRVMLKPAGAGTGVIAGSTVRAMCDAVGIKNILTKTLGSRNTVNVVKATLNGFEQLRLKRRGVQ